MRWQPLSILLTVSVMVFTGCSRNQSQMVADAKTAGRHLSRSVRALFGDLTESRLVTSADVFATSELTRQYEIAPGYEELAAQQTDVFPVAMDIAGDGRSGTPTIEQFLEPHGELAQVFSKIYFDTDSSQISQASAQKTVQQMAHYLQQHPHVLLAVEGHCDERGPALYNLSLGARRANAIRAALVKSGVEADRVLTVSYGKERPAVPGNGPDALSKNRRAQFRVYQAGQ